MSLLHITDNVDHLLWMEASLLLKGWSVYHLCHYAGMEVLLFGNKYLQTSSVTQGIRFSGGISNMILS